MIVPKNTHKVCEIRYSRKSLTDDELEGDGGEEEDERDLEPILRFGEIHCERCERKAADEQLRNERNGHC